MYIIITASVFAALAGIAFWMSRLRPVDQISLFVKVIAKIGLHKRFLQRPELCNVALSNGFELKNLKTIKCVMEEVFKLEMRQDDVIVATYTKAGTTWMQEIVWLICNDGDIAAAKDRHVLDRYGFLDIPDVANQFGKGFQSLENWPKHERRFIKTHLPFQVLPHELQSNSRGKMIYVVRNPKDNCVSFYHFHRMNKALPEPGTWSEFLLKFCNGDVLMGSWFDHVQKYWQVYQDRKDSMYFVSYENLAKDLKEEVIKLARFLEKDLSEEKIVAIVQHCTFSNMSKNVNTNYSQVCETGLMDFEVSKFMRKGVVGDWKNHFTINQNTAFDEMFKERTKDWSWKLEFEPTK